MPFIGVDDPGLPSRRLVQRQIGGIASIGKGDDKAGAGFDLRKQGIEGDTFPVRVQLRPLGHAVDIFSDRLTRHSMELLPAPAFWLIDLAHNREIP